MLDVREKMLMREEKMDAREREREKISHKAKMNRVKSCLLSNCLGHREKHTTHITIIDKKEIELLYSCGEKTYT